MIPEDQVLVPPAALKGRVEVTGAILIKKLREIVKPPGKKGLWLRHLSDRRLAEVYHRLKMGQAGYRIAKIAQDEWGILKTSDTKSLARAVRIFRDKTVDLITIEKSTAPDTEPERKRVASAAQKRALRIRKNLDALGRMRWLIDVQTERIVAMATTEVRENVSFKSTDKSIGELRELLDTYMKWAVETGVYDAKPHELQVNFKHQFDGLVGNLSNDGARLISAADKFLELAENAALTMVMDDTGKYQALNAPTIPGSLSEDIEDTE